MNIKINNQDVKVNENQTVLEAANSIGINIPTLCHIDGLSPSGACRICVVELADTGKLVTSCSTKVSPEMDVKTHSPKVLDARKTILELLLSNHPDECLYCTRNGRCELQSMSQDLGIKDRVYKNTAKPHRIDNSSLSIVRDPSKCILCGRCVRVCEEIQGVSAIDFTNRGSSAQVEPAFNQGLNISSCVNCGQCINVCPTGALYETTNINKVTSALNDPKKIVVVQHAPAISVTIGEYFNLDPDLDATKLLNSAFRTLGFDKVFDTSFSADLTIMEEASEFVHRFTSGGTIPMFTSCSPAWVKFVEQFYPEFIPNLSTCKSPQQMLGAIIKSYFAKTQGVDPNDIYVVSVMPCTAKNFEAHRPEMINDNTPDVDCVITTRELSKLFSMYNIDLNKLKPDEADSPFGEKSSAGKLFGVTGGVMEASIRTANYLLTGKELDTKAIKEIRDLNGVKESSVTINGNTFNVAVVSGLGNARKVLEDIKNGIKNYHFVEFMACPGGCINGGGQPVGLDKERVKKRMKLLYKIDKNAKTRTSHSNTHVKRLYDEFLSKPLGKNSHKLLHTKYIKRDTKN